MLERSSVKRIAVPCYSEISSMRRCVLSDGATGSYSGPEVPIEEVRFRRKWRALSSPRMPFLEREVGQPLGRDPDPD